MGSTGSRPKMVELLPVCVWSNGTVTDWLLPLPLNSRRTGMLFPSAQPITAPVSQLPSTLESHPDAPVVQGGFDWPSRFVCPSVKVVVSCVYAVACGDCVLGDEVIGQ